MPFNLLSTLDIRKFDKLSSLQRVASVFMVISMIVLISWLISTSKITHFYNAILPHNQAYTELAFNDVNSIPSSASRNNQVNFSFIIHNVEGKTFSYTYVITLEKGNAHETLKDETVTLGSNSAVSISENLPVQNSDQRQEVVVTLTNLNQSVDFWLKGSDS